MQRPTFVTRFFEEFRILMEKEEEMALELIVFNDFN